MSHMIFQKYGPSQGSLMGSPGNPGVSTMLLGTQRVRNYGNVGTRVMEEKARS